MSSWPHRSRGVDPQGLTEGVQSLATTCESPSIAAIDASKVILVILNGPSRPLRRRAPWPCKRSRATPPPQPPQKGKSTLSIAVDRLLGPSPARGRSPDFSASMLKAVSPSSSPCWTPPRMAPASAFSAVSRCPVSRHATQNLSCSGLGTPSFTARRVESIILTWSMAPCIPESEILGDLHDGDSRRAAHRGDSRCRPHPGLSRAKHLPLSFG